MKREIYRIICNKMTTNNGGWIWDQYMIEKDPKYIGQYVLKEILYSDNKYFLEYWNGHYRVISDDRVQVFIRPIEEDGTTQNKAK